MKIFGLPIPFTAQKKALQSVQPGGGGWFRVMESFAGAWQHNVTVDYETVVFNPAIFACETLIRSDIAKLRVKLVQRNADGIWLEVDNYTYRVLSRPNHFQTRIQFFEDWLGSKLRTGNAYILKERDAGGNVVAMYVLDPRRVTPMVADNGDVFYQVMQDRLAGVGNVMVPAREMIHDRYNTQPGYPLMGVSPLLAAGMSGTLGSVIQKQAAKFFENGARPGGILSAPGEISDETATRLKEYWTTNFTGNNAGKIAVLGDGLKYEAMAATAVDSQLAEQWKLTAEVIASCYHVPPFKIGVGATPSYNNVQSLNIEYHNTALQVLIESIELLLDEALGLKGEIGSGTSLGVEIEIDGLLRMDSGAQYDVLEKAKNVLTLNERRAKVERPGLDGGDTIFMQQQDHSMEAIAARDAQLIDQANNPPVPPANDAANDNAMEQQAAAAMIEILKGLR